MKQRMKERSNCRHSDRGVKLITRVGLVDRWVIIASKFHLISEACQFYSQSSTFRSQGMSKNISSTFQELRLYTHWCFSIALSPNQETMAYVLFIVPNNSTLFIVSWAVSSIELSTLAMRLGMLYELLLWSFQCFW